MSKTLRARVVTLVGAVALSVGAAVVAPTAAHAAPTNLGTLAFTPSSGVVTDPGVGVAASGACPSGTGTVFVQINGAGWDNLSAGYGVLVGSTPIDTATGHVATGKPHSPLPQSLSEIARDASVTWAAGDYAVKLVCIDSTTLDSAGTAVFSTTLHFTDATHWSNGAGGPVTKPVIKLSKAAALVGTFKVGKKVSVTKGTWRVTGIVVHYQWLRDNRTIKGATRATYTLAKSDKGHLVTCRVVVTKSGYTSAQSTPKAKKVA